MKGFRGSPLAGPSCDKRSWTHARLVAMAEAWLRRQRCGIVLSEQGCSSGEMPDAIGWKGKNHSMVIECKISRADFLADSAKPWRRDPAIALGCERYFAAPKAMLKAEEMPEGWGLLEVAGTRVEGGEEVQAQPAPTRRTDERDESAAGQSAPGRGAH